MKKQVLLWISVCLISACANTASMNPNLPSNNHALGYRLTDAEAAEFERGYDLTKQQQYDEAIAIYHHLAEKGHSTSMYNLGIIYRDLRQVGTAIPWLERAVQAGEVDAHCPLGSIQYDIQSYKSAVRHYEKAAAQGFACGQARLSHMYAYGQGVKRDYRRSFALAQQAAQQNEPQGQYLLGIHYLNSWSVPYDPAQGRQWLEKAAAQQYQPAIEALQGE